MLDLEQIQPRLWEKDLYLRIGCIHLIQSASSTLQSLIQLLGKFCLNCQLFHLTISTLSFL